MAGPMRRLALLALLVLALPAAGQHVAPKPCKMDGSDCAAGGGSGTVTSVGNGTISGLFTATWATATTTPKLSLAMAAAAANTVLAGPTTGADAAPTFRALVSADLGSYTLNPTFNTVVGMPATNVSAAAFRRSGAGATANIVEFQTSANALLSGVKADGTFYGPGLSSIIGTNLGISATAPAATTGASQAGKTVTISGSAAVASTDTAGAAAGGSVTITAGDAARNTSGNANGGDINLVTGAGIGTGAAGQVVVPAGTGNRPSLVFAGSSGTGFSGTTSLYSWAGGTLLGYWGTTTGLMSAYGFSWNAVGSADDSYLTRRAAQSLQWGKPSASPATYTLTGNSSRSGTDSNVAGGAVVYSGGLGTGTAASGTLTLSAGTPQTTGTAQHVAAPVLTLANTGVGGTANPFIRIGSATVGTQMASYTKTLTNNSATGVIDVTVPSGGGCGGMLGYTAVVTGTGKVQSYNGMINFSVANNAGTVTTAITEGSGTGSHDAKVLDGGTLAGTWTNVAGTGKSTLTVNINSNVTSPVVNIYIWAKLDGTAGCALTGL